jgi:hypothetical protein
MPGLLACVPVSSLAFTGAFETHVTLAAPPDGADDEVALFAVRLGAKFVHIVLDRGRTPSQPMLTVTGSGTRRAQIEASGDLVRGLVGAGFRVVRVKVEAAPGNEDIPADDAAAGRLGDSMYFEHHVKVVLDEDPADGVLAALLGRFGARLSRNARRHRADGKAEWFATQRCYRSGLPRASARLDSLVSALTEAGWPPVEVEREFVVYDSAPAVDDGWLE